MPELSGRSWHFVFKGRKGEVIVIGKNNWPSAMEKLDFSRVK